MKEFVLKNTDSPKGSQIDYQAELNKEQLDVVLHGDGPCLVLAGAGSGKTRTITYRLASLIEKGVSPDAILLVTFTNKAAREMTDRVEKLLHGFPTGLWSGTFHSVANRLLRRFAPLIGFTSNFSILDQEDSKTFIKVCLKELKIDVQSKRFPSPAVLQSLLSFARNARMPIWQVLEEKYPHFMSFRSTIEQIGEAYEGRKKKADSMDFDDLLLSLRALLVNHEHVRRQLAEQFRYILVDEYQDTNRLQSEIVNMLASHHGNLLVVGDDAQSIYSFRAAQIRNILDFPKQFSQTKTFRLVTNYRSIPEILEVANASIEHNEEQFPKDLSAVRKSAGKPCVIACSSASQEARYIAEQILTLRNEGIPLSQMAVLFRAAFHSQTLEMELLKKDIPYEYRGGLKFFERAHIKDVVAYVRLFLNVKDEMAWMRVLGHQPGIGLVSAGKIFGRIQRYETVEQILQAEIEEDLPARSREGWRGFHSIAQKMLSDADSPSACIRSLASSGYREYLEAQYPDMHDRLDDLEQFALFAEQYENLQSFLDDISLQNDYGTWQKNTDAEQEGKLVLSTIHQAKGLEWDVVFVMHLSNASFPNPRALEEKGGIEEERRLFYVAITRARNQLFLSYPITVGHDYVSMSTPSLFLKEIPSRLLEQIKIQDERSRFSQRNEDGFEEPAIVWNEDGDTTNPEDFSSRSFLRSVDDL